MTTDTDTTTNGVVVDTHPMFGTVEFPSILQRPDGAELFSLRLTRRQLEIVVGMLGAFSPLPNMDTTESQQLYSNIFEAAKAANIETNPFTIFGVETPEAQKLQALVALLRGVTRIDDQTVTTDSEQTVATDVSQQA